MELSGCRDWMVEVGDFMPTWKDIAYKYVVKHDHTAEAAGHLVAGNTVVIPDPDGDLSDPRRLGSSCPFGGHR